MKEFKHFIVPDDVYYFVLSYCDFMDIRKKVCEMTKEEFLEIYDKAVEYNRNKIMDNDEYFEIL